MKTFNPKNQHELVLYYLFNYSKVTMKEVINDSMFYKWPTRLSELESKYGTFTKKERVKFTNRFGYSGSYVEYSLSNKELAEKILLELKK